MEILLPTELLQVAAAGSVSVVALLLAWRINRKNRYPSVYNAPSVAMTIRVWPHD